MYTESGLLPQYADPLLIVDSIQYLDERGVYYDTADFDYLQMFADPPIPPPFFSETVTYEFGAAFQSVVSEKIKPGNEVFDQQSEVRAASEDPFVRVGESPSASDSSRPIVENGSKLNKFKALLAS